MLRAKKTKALSQNRPTTALSDFVDIQVWELVAFSLFKQDFKYLPIARLPIDDTLPIARAQLYDSHYSSTPRNADDLYCVGNAISILLHVIRNGTCYQRHAIHSSKFALSERYHTLRSLHVWLLVCAVVRPEHSIIPELVYSAYWH
jgi:hypothetical protein